MIGAGFWNRSKKGIEYLASHIVSLEERMNGLASRAHGTDGKVPFTWELQQAAIRSRARQWSRWM